MKILKNLLRVKNDGLFDEKDNVILTEDTAYLMDCILCVFLAIEVKTLYLLNLEMYRCGIQITYPDLKKVVNYLIKEGLLSNNLSKN